ncbi:MAG: hypothetical protein L0Z62_09850, partial [Gemmataceae bacterium]|nr:hypothetical protein [Gemmataceae bacterium]
GHRAGGDFRETTDYYEFGQVVVPEVTIPALTKIIPHLVEEGYLERHVPLREPAVDQTLRRAGPA